SHRCMDRPSACGECRRTVEIGPARCRGHTGLDLSSRKVVRALMNTPSESTTAALPLPRGSTSAPCEPPATAPPPTDAADSTMIGLRNDLRWLRTRLAVAAASAAVLVLVSVYWPAANAGAGVRRLPAVAFQTKTLVDAGGRPRERDARLLMQDGQLIVTAKDADRPARVLSYGAVRSISYSHG